MITYNDITSVLDELGIEYAYHHFNQPIDADRYIAFFEDEKNVALADNHVYTWNPSFAIELYTKLKEPETEVALIQLLEKHNIPWSGGASTYIDSERVYLTVFYI